MTQVSSWLLSTDANSPEKRAAVSHQQPMIIAVRGGYSDPVKGQRMGLENSIYISWAF